MPPVSKISYFGIFYNRIYIIQVKNSIYTKEYQAFLKRLKQARLDAGLTQADVAKQLQQQQSYVSKCESGEKRVDVIELMRFAKLYGKTIDWFVQ